MLNLRLKHSVIALAAVLLINNSQGATTETRSIASQTMNKAFGAIIITPDSYAKSSAAYPVVYLLHGFGANNAGWEKIGVAQFADQYSLIIVCPSGGDSWYFDSPLNPNSKFETYISSEVVQYMDQNFRTVKSPRGRATCGNSMGGHGAMYLALRHKDIFGAAGSMSGGLDIRPFPKNWNISKYIGTIEEHPEEWEARAAINNISNLQNGELALIIDCGLKDFFLKVNRGFHEALVKQRIDHDYIERPGAHDVNYWKNSIQYQMLFFHNFFAKAAQTTVPQ